MLTALLLAGDQGVSDQTLFAAVWNDPYAHDREGPLKSCINQLRGLLPGDRIPRKEAGRYRLVLREGDTCDADEFRALADAGITAAAADNRHDAAASLKRALMLWKQGHPPLGDVAEVCAHDPGLQAVHDALLSKYQAAQSALFDALMALDRYQELIEELRAEISRQPLTEELHLMLVRALHLAGYRTEALRHCESAAATMTQATGLPSTQRLRQLYAQLSAEQQPASVPSPTARQAPAPVPVPAQLPPDVADFTGRRTQIDQLLDVLTPTAATTAVPIAVISGMGGVGKSALATHVAHRLRHLYPDGQLFVHLASMSRQSANIAEALAELLISLNVATQDLPSSTAGRSGMLRSVLAGRRVLVVIDDAASLHQVQPFLPGTAGCAVIITSRAAIPGPGMRTIRLEPLDEAESTELLAGIIGADRIERQPQEASALLAACGGLPLAVRIVGARLAVQSHWDLSLLVSRLRNRLEGLAEGDVTIAATIADSYEALSGTVQAGLRMLSMVGAGDWPMWLAEMLLGADQADVVLGSLSMHSLLSPAGVDDLGHPRYRMHDLVRAFAEERLAEHIYERDVAMSRLLGGWLLLTDRAAALTSGEPWFQPPARVFTRHLSVPPIAQKLIDADADTWLAGESAQILAVIRLACSEHRYQQAYGLALRISAHLYRRGRRVDAENMWRNIMLATSSADDERLTAEARNRVAALILAARPDHPERVIPIVNECVEVFARLVDRPSWSRALALRALCRYHLARQSPEEASAAALQHAVEDAEKGLELAQTTEEEYVELMCRRMLALLASAQGHHEEAIAHCRTAVDQATDLTQQIRDPAYEVATVIAMAAVLVAANRHQEALEMCQRGTAHLKRVHDTAAAAALADLAGDAYTALGEYAQAERSYETAVTEGGADTSDPLHAQYTRKLSQVRALLRQKA
ncbi:AfsR/SARP family transcriptional regulator [Streptosporangium sandarakinum]